MVTFSEFKTWFLPQILISYAFILSGLIVNVFQLITFICVWPFNKLLYKRIIYYLGYGLYANITSLAQWWAGTEIDVYMNEEDFKMLGKENCICVFNHKYDIDWVMGWLLCQKINTLGKNKSAKVVLKSSLKYIPILGWSWAFSEYVFVKRVWETDLKSLVRDLKSILDYPKDLFYSIAIFCEGTRFTKEKYEESMKIAKEKNMPLLKHHLLPRSKGFTLIASQVKGKIDYLYDINLGIDDVDGHQPTMGDIKNGIPIKAQVFIRRIPMSQVPVDDEKQCAAYLQKLYQEKDVIYDAFYKNGDFSSLGEKKHVIKKNKYDLYVSIFWLVIILVPSLYYLFFLIWNGSWALKLVFATFIFSVNFIIKWMIGKSSSKNGSEFGLPSKKQD